MLSRIAVLLVTLFGLAAAPASAAPARDYVALGDSYASGPGIPVQSGGCGRSSHNYPSVLARWIRATTFTDASCGGATTRDMFSPQPISGGANPPQLDAVTRRATLVTLSIGGNDIGFGEILTTCGRLAAADPTGAPCKAHYTAGGEDVLAKRIEATAADVAAVLDEIHRRAPRAKVVLVGYLRILPDGPGCWPSVPFAAGDTAYFDATERLLNTTLARVAKENDALFADPYPASTGHDACAAPDTRWVEPLRPTSPAAPIHPNARGMAVTAAVTLVTALLG
ncbi:SGNH/GDSL hydrolase family protein [Actinokineospora fastidiosa]|uniref:Lipase n=1 Tax=Actinokineospora fastidiosa TaxID=1816 RepID=A0A918GAL9_9PSEU|nr:SGNH/GDSL hydrolase family protein [Actinokineospora fastidiosa]GGS26133.1 lipase [Actinokineospora fastidiosa]